MEISREEILKIVDRCFHIYASSFRNDAKEEASQMIDDLIEVKKLIIPVVSNSVICCPQCGNERLESTGNGWYICADRSCDWGDKL